MPDVPEPTQAKYGAMRKMALTETERKLVEAHRAKTAADRAFNDGLDHALECLDFGGTAEAPVGTPNWISAVQQKIMSARRDV